MRYVGGREGLGGEDGERPVLLRKEFLRVIERFELEAFSEVGGRFSGSVVDSPGLNL